MAISSAVADSPRFKEISICGSQRTRGSLPRRDNRTTHLPHVTALETAWKPQGPGRTITTQGALSAAQEACQKR